MFVNEILECHGIHEHELCNLSLVPLQLKTSEGVQARFNYSSLSSDPVIRIDMSDYRIYGETVTVSPIGFQLYVLQ